GENSLHPHTKGQWLQGKGGGTRLTRGIKGRSSGFTAHSCFIKSTTARGQVSNLLRVWCVLHGFSVPLANWGRSREHKQNNKESRYPTHWKALDGPCLAPVMKGLLCGGKRHTQTKHRHVRCTGGGEGTMPPMGGAEAYPG